jgi:hypothetical protein
VLSFADLDGPLIGQRERPPPCDAFMPMDFERW